MSRASSGMPVGALFLDLDETLLDGSRFGETIAHTCQEIAELSGLDARRLLEANSGVFPEYWPEVFDRWTLGSLDGAALSLEAWRRTLRACRYHDDSLAQRASQIHLQLGRESYRLFDDARELLAAAPRFGLRLGLITNGASDTQRDKLQALGIEGSFDVVVISGEVGIAKPDVYPFELALSQLALPPERVWHIGDNLVTDVAGAKAASVRAIWVNRSGRPRQTSEPAPDVEIRTLCDLIGELSE